MKCDENWPKHFNRLQEFCKTPPDFQSASYLERYNILCRKLTHERLYTTATTWRRRARANTSKSELTGLKTFITNFAGHIAAEAARDA